MAEKVTCGVAGCDRRYFPGHGGRGGEAPRCAMHLKREERGASNQDDPDPTRGPPRDRITIRIDAKLLRWVRAQARLAGIQASSWIHRVLLDKMAGGAR
jgi:hypothetical protein